MEMKSYSNQLIYNADSLELFEEEEFQFDQEESERGWSEEYPASDDNGSTPSEPFSYYPYSSAAAYFREVGHVALLTREQECKLARKIEEGKKRIKIVLLQSPVGLEWMSHVVNQLVRGELHPGDVLEAPAQSAGGEEEDDLTVRDRFLSAAGEVLDLCTENDGLREEIHVAGGEGSAIILTMTGNQMVIEAFLDQMPIKKTILEDLEDELRQQVDLMEGDGVMSWPVTFRQRLKTILSIVQRFQQEVKQAKHDFVSANLRLVINIAKKHINRGLSLSDLIQEGNIGLMKAVDRFNHRKGYRFATYASWWILQGITRAVAEQARTIRVPVHAIENETKVVKTFGILLNQLGRKPTAWEIAEAANMPVEKVNKTFRVAMGEPISLETPVGDSGTEFGDFIADKHASSPLETTIQTNLTREIRKALVFLTPREAKILRMRFGIDEKREYTLDEIGREFGISRERIRQIENAALRKLKHAKGESNLGNFYE